MRPAAPSRFPPRPRCVITGAADGIGRALARTLSEEGYEIVGIDRDRARSERTLDEIREAGGDATFLGADLADPNDLERVVALLVAGPPVELLIQSAGISAVGRFTRLPFPAQRAVIDVNLLAPLHLTGALLREGALAPAPRIVQLASLSCFTSYPGAAVYAATKDGLASWGRSLSVALGPRAQLLTVYPGPVRTRHAARYSPDNSRADRRMPPELLAGRIARALRRGRRGRLVPGPANRAAALLGRFAPRVMEGVMRRVILERLDEVGGPADGTPGGSATGRGNLPPERLR